MIPPRIIWCAGMRLRGKKQEDERGEKRDWEARCNRQDFRQSCLVQSRNLRIKGNSMEGRRICYKKALPGVGHRQKKGKANSQKMSPGEGVTSEGVDKTKGLCKDRRNY